MGAKDQSWLSRSRLQYRLNRSAQCKVSTMQLPRVNFPGTIWSNFESSPTPCLHVFKKKHVKLFIHTTRVGYRNLRREMYFASNVKCFQMIPCSPPNMCHRCISKRGATLTSFSTGCYHRGCSPTNWGQNGSNFFSWPSSKRQSYLKYRERL